MLLFSSPTKPPSDRRLSQRRSTDLFFITEFSIFCYVPTCNCGNVSSPPDFHKIPIKLQNGIETGVEVLQCGENDGSGSSASITSALSLVKYTQKA